MRKKVRVVQAAREGGGDLPEGGYKSSVTVDAPILSFGVRVPGIQRNREETRMFSSFSTS